MIGQAMGASNLLPLSLTASNAPRKPSTKAAGLLKDWDMDI